MKKIVIDIMQGKSTITASVQSGDSNSVELIADNLPGEWGDSVYVYALVTRAEIQTIQKMETKSTSTKSCYIPSEFTSTNKAFKIVIFGASSEIDGDTLPSGYRYASEPVWVSVGEGLEGMTVKVLPDSEKFDAISTLLVSLSEAVTAEKERKTAEGERVTAETERAEAEEERKTAEIARGTAETERASAETSRIESESGRVTAEEERTEQELQRKEAEELRADAEDERNLAEEGRAEAELGRRSMIESRYFSSYEEYEDFIDNIRNTKIFKISWGGTESEPFTTDWLITDWTDTSDGNNSRTQVKISMGNIYTRSYIVWEYDNVGGNTPVDKWSEWQPIVDNSMLESRLQRFADEFTIDVDQTYNPKSENAQSGKAVAEAIAQIVNGSPEALDTLYELAEALGNDKNFSTTVMNEIGKKANSSYVGEMFDKISNGDLIAAKAFRDGSGNIFAQYYAKKSEIPTVDTELNAESTNAIQNKAVAKAVSDIPVAVVTMPLNSPTFTESDELSNLTDKKLYRLQHDRTGLCGWLFCSQRGGSLPSECDQLLIDCDNNIYRRNSVRQDDEYEWAEWERFATVADIESAIGDVETSLDNIIKKYGLGGDSV